MMSGFENIHVLLADDDPDDREFFGEAISNVIHDDHLWMFKDGMELTDFLHKNPGDPDNSRLLFLDLNMPRKTGLDCLREIRQHKSFDDLAIAIYSTSSADKDVQDSFDAGANLYIKKPSDFTLLKNVIREVAGIDWKRQRADLNFKNFVFR